MKKDVKSVGYGVKIGNQLVSDYKENFEGVQSVRIDVLNGIQIKKMSGSEATRIAKAVNGKVVELYAREVEDSEDGTNE